MEFDRVVDILFPDTGQYGSGYLITNQMVLTARHVAGDNVAGTPCRITPLQIRGTATGQSFDAFVAWVSEQSDAALLRVQKKIPGLRPQPIIFGSPPVTVGELECEAIGFPDSQDQGGYNEDRRLSGKLTWVIRDNRFNIDVGNATPTHADNWRGFSGAAVFSKGRPVGVIRSYDERFGGRVLEATPIGVLIGEESFRRSVDPVGDLRALLDWEDFDSGTQEWAYGSGRPSPGLNALARLKPHLADRTKQETTIRRYVEGVLTGAIRRPGVFFVHGAFDQCVDRFLDRVVDYTLPRALQRLSAQDQVGDYDIDWPTVETDGDDEASASDLLSDMMEQLRTHLKLPPNCDQRGIYDALANTAAANVITCELTPSRWTQSHTALLRQLLGWWQSYPDLHSPVRPVLIVFYMTYNLGWPRNLLVARHIRPAIEAVETEIGRAVADKELSGAVLPRLDGVFLHEAISWTRAYLVNHDPAAVRERLYRKFTILFGIWQRQLSMKTVVGELEKLLDEDSAMAGPQ